MTYEGEPHVRRTGRVTDVDVAETRREGAAGEYGRSRNAAMASIAVTVVVLVFMDWIPTPLNQNILQTTPKQRLVGTLIHASVGSLIFLANAIGRHWLIFAGAVWYSVVLVSAVLNWWVPYVFGIYPGEISVDNFVREYSSNLTVLPPILDHPVIPDVQYTRIHLCVLFSCGFSWLAIRGATEVAGKRE